MTPREDFPTGSRDSVGGTHRLLRVAPSVVAAVGDCLRRWRLEVGRASTMLIARALPCLLLPAPCPGCSFAADSSTARRSVGVFVPTV